MLIPREGRQTHLSFWRALKYLLKIPVGVAEEIMLSLHFMLLQRNVDRQANKRARSDVLVRNNILLSIHQGSLMLPSRNERLREKSVHNNHIHCKHFFFCYIINDE